MARAGGDDGWAPLDPGWSSPKPGTSSAQVPPPPPGWAPPGRPAGRQTTGTAATGPLPLHPMSVGDILDGAFKLLKANARTVALVALVFVVPLQLLLAWLQRDLFGGTGLIEIFGSDPEVAAETVNEDGASSWAGLVSIVGGSLLLPFVAAALSRVVFAAYLGAEISPGRAIRAALGRSWALFAAWLLIHILEAIGTVACILPGVAVMTFFVLVAPIISIEESGPIASMRRSARLVSRRFWPTLGVVILAGLIAYFLGQTLALAPTMGGFLVGLEWGWILVGVGGILASLVSQPILAIVATLLYLDARIRQEGFDLQVAAARMSGPAVS